MKRAIAVTLVIILSISLFACGKPATLSAAELLDLGEKYLLELDYEQALVQFLKVIEIEPMNPRGYTGAAEAYVGLGQVVNAIEVLQKGLESLPSNTEIETLLDAMNQSDMEGALVSGLDAAIEIPPDIAKENIQIPDERDRRSISGTYKPITYEFVDLEGRPLDVYIIAITYSDYSPAERGAFRGTTEELLEWNMMRISEIKDNQVDDNIQNYSYQNGVLLFETNLDEVRVYWETMPIHDSGSGSYSASAANVYNKNSAHSIIEVEITNEGRGSKWSVKTTYR